MLYLTSPPELSTLSRVTLRCANKCFFVAFIWHAWLFPALFNTLSTEFLAHVALVPDGQDVLKEHHGLLNSQMKRQFGVMGATTHTVVFLCGVALLTMMSYIKSGNLISRMLSGQPIKGTLPELPVCDVVIPFLVKGFAVASGFAVCLLIQQVMWMISLYCYRQEYGFVSQYVSMFFKDDSEQMFVWTSSVSYTIVFWLGFLTHADESKSYFERTFLPSATLNEWVDSIGIPFGLWVASLDNVFIPMVQRLVGGHEPTGDLLDLLMLAVGVFMCSSHIASHFSIETMSQHLHGRVIPLRCPAVGGVTSEDRTLKHSERANKTHTSARASRTHTSERAHKTHTSERASKTHTSEPPSQTHTSTSNTLPAKGTDSLPLCAVPTCESRRKPHTQTKPPHSAMFNLPVFLLLSCQTSVADMLNIDSDWIMLSILLTFSCVNFRNATIAVARRNLAHIAQLESDQAAQERDVQESVERMMPCSKTSDFHFRDLPHDVCLTIFQFLSEVEDLPKVAFVSRSEAFAVGTCLQHGLWRLVFRRDPPLHHDGNPKREQQHANQLVRLYLKLLRWENSTPAAHLIALGDADDDKSNMPRAACMGVWMSVDEMMLCVLEEPPRSRQRLVGYSLQGPTLTRCWVVDGPGRLLGPPTMDLGCPFVAMNNEYLVVSEFGTIAWFSVATTTTTKAPLYCNAVSIAGMRGSRLCKLLFVEDHWLVVVTRSCGLARVDLRTGEVATRVTDFHGMPLFTCDVGLVCDGATTSMLVVAQEMESGLPTLLCNTDLSGMHPLSDDSWETRSVACAPRRGIIAEIVDIPPFQTVCYTSDGSRLYTAKCGSWKQTTAPKVLFTDGLTTMVLHGQELVMTCARSGAVLRALHVADLVGSQLHASLKQGCVVSGRTKKILVVDRSHCVHILCF